MTNGEKFKQTFPNSFKVRTFLMLNGTEHIVIDGVDGETHDFTLDWWNAEYKEPIPKENLVVEDCISCKSLLDYAFHSKLSIYEDLKEIVDYLPRVLPKTKITKWKKETIKKITEGNCTIYEPKWTCSECGQIYDGGIANSIIKYCFNCGCKMEVEDADSNMDNSNM